MSSTNAPITLDAPVFPYLVKDDSTTSTSYIAIEHEEMYRDDERTLFYIVGGQLNMSSKNHQMNSETTINIRHSFGCDEENDSARVADFTVRSLTITASYGNTVVFTGWLTKAMFYPDDAVDSDGYLVNPFIGAEKQPDGANGYGNALYPYLPPVVTFGKAVQFPLPVTITLYHNQGGDLAQKLDGYMDKHAEARAEREAKAEADRVALEKRREESRRWEAEWIKSEEGQIYTVERKMFAGVKKAAPTPISTDEEKAAVQVQAVADFAEFTAEEKALLLKGQPNRRKIPRSDIGGRAYVEKFEALLSGE